MDTNKSGAPLIGEFSGPPSNKPRSAAVKEQSASLQQEEQQKKESEDKASNQAEKSKVEMYHEGLKAAGVTIEMARTILDKVLFEGSYSEEFKIGGRLIVTLRTRMYKDSQRILRFLESESPTIPMHVSDLVARFNVAASLQSYGDSAFTFPIEGKSLTSKDMITTKDVEDAFHQRLEFLMGLPTPVVNILINFTREFDEKITAVFAEGAPEDF